MGMMYEFSAYSWQQQRLEPGIEQREERAGWCPGTTRGCNRTSNNINDGVAWVVGSTAWTRKIGSGEVGRGCLRRSRLPVYIHPHARIRLERPKQIFGASPLKTRDEPTDELICFPTTLLSSLSFFAYPPLPSPAFRWPPPTPRDAYIAENIRAFIWKWLL